MNRTILFLLFSLLPFLSLAQEKSQNLSPDGHMIISCPVVEKEYVNKKGQPTDKKELYLRLSMADYYIKFCESKVSEEQLKGFVSSYYLEPKIARLEIEILDGNWDQCNQDQDVASRTGRYVIIHKLLDDE